MNRHLIAYLPEKVKAMLQMIRIDSKLAVYFRITSIGCFRSRGICEKQHKLLSDSYYAVHFIWTLQISVARLLIHRAEFDYGN
jgi:hypothetical protein